MLKILIYPILVLVSRGPRTIFTSLTRSLGSDTDILPSNAESSKQNRGRATGGCNLITFRAPRIKGKFSNYVAKLHYILKCAARAVTINKNSDDAKLALTHRLRGATFSLDHFKILCTFAWLVSVFTKLMDLLSGFEPRVVF